MFAVGLFFSFSDFCDRWQWEFQDAAQIIALCFFSPPSSVSVSYLPSVTSPCVVDALWRWRTKKKSWIAGWRWMHTTNAQTRNKRKNWPWKIAFRFFHVRFSVLFGPPPSLNHQQLATYRNRKHNNYITLKVLRPFLVFYNILILFRWTRIRNPPNHSLQGKSLLVLVSKE